MQQPETVAHGPPAKVSSRALQSGFTTGHFSLLLILAIFAAFPKIVLGLETFVIRDFGFFAYPLAYFQRECFWRGELPLWNPYSHCGVPFLAQWNTMPLYPPVLIYLVLPLPWSLNLFCLLHLFWAGLGMYLLARRWTESNLGAAVAGLAFGYNGFALNLLMWPSHVATYSWMPWVILAVEIGWERGGRALFLAALVGAMQMLAGGPETILFTWLILTAFWINRLFTWGWNRKCHSSNDLESIAGRESAGLILRFPAMVALVAGLAAVQLLPFLDLAAHSQREQGFADARWSMPSWGWANLLVPMVFGTSGKQGLFFQYDQYWTSSYYLGIAVLLLAILAICRKSGAKVWLLVGIATFGLLLATGDKTVFSRWARQLLPQLTLMTYPVKYVTLVVFSAPLLAAFGLRRLERAPEAQPLWRRLAIGAGILMILILSVMGWAWLFPFATDDVSATVGNGAVRIGILLLAVLLLRMLYWPTAKPVAGRLLPAAPVFSLFLLILLWVDVRTHEPQQNPGVPGWVYTPGLARTKLKMDPQPELGFSRAMLSPAAEVKFRELVMNDPKDNFLVKRLGYFANCNLLDHVPTANGFYSLAPRECGELNSLLYVSRYAFSSPLPDFLSVSQVTSDEDYTAWKSRTTYLPLITAGQAPAFLPDTNALGIMFSTNFDAARFVLLPVEAKAWVGVTNQTRASVIPLSLKPSCLEFEVEAEQPSMVVLSQTYYHPWKVWVDDRKERLLRANFAFQALQVPAGKHRVVVAYEDRAFFLGGVISCIGLFVCCLGWLVVKRRFVVEASPAC